MNWTGQVAILTGASSGIGWELARALAAEGLHVGLIARRGDKLAELADAIQRQGGKAAWAVADVGDREQVQAAVAELTRELGPADLLIANAGVAPSTHLEPMNVADVETIVRVNLLGMIYAVEAVLPAMLARGRGHLAAVSSLGSYLGLPGEAAYCASKAAVNTFMESLRLELRSRGVAVTTICPGFVRTPMTAANAFEMPWLLEPADAARRIVRGLRRRKKVIDFPWQLAWLIKLARWMPDWFLARYLTHQYPVLPPQNAEPPLAEAPGR